VTGGDLVLVGDIHLDAPDARTEAFLRFLDRMSSTASTVVLAGDLFSLWIGLPDMEQEHHRAVVAKLVELRARGVRTHYLEGNRDYRISRAHVGTAFDSAPGQGLALEHGGRRVFAIHGDLANVEDRQYRTWRRLSRSAPVWGLFRALPRARRRRWAEGLEVRMRDTNLDYKKTFPEDQVRAYGEGYLSRGHDAVVLGHFHVEKDLGRIFVLPEWSASRRHLRVSAGGEIGFVDSPE